MTRVFGEVASTYHDVRPGYPDAVRSAITGYAGGPPRSVVELGAGTGKATAVLTGFGVPYTAVEPDPRMAAVLRANFPAVEVTECTFEEWTPPAGGVDLITCATAWQWMEPETRNRRAYDALVPGGVLAILAHTYGIADTDEAAAIDALYQRFDPDVPRRGEHWVRADLTAAGLWPDVEDRLWHTYPSFSTARYQALVRTFSPFRRHAPEVQGRLLGELEGLIESFGGVLTLDLTTTLTLARRPA
ncbi:class I SAM-dependent methyltransferase [Paractinoplanes rishiriensis]|uniref:Methyltransferase domain-containing protein n=1 Tax=Paractinoplanes rishiriensis TaxID=1050105 RepID=A0A919MXK4_9ACTN|nr:class I SAM-dependent methyltransferase [Actinoplanes rishiriensis]GIE99008.1 hypothetical protein Ari01nite_64730 [Actinoplanes rishiriensis]